MPFITHIMLVIINYLRKMVTKWSREQYAGAVRIFLPFAASTSSFAPIDRSLEHENCIWTFDFRFVTLRFLICVLIGTREIYFSMVSFDNQPAAHTRMHSRSQHMEIQINLADVGTGDVSSSKICSKCASQKLWECRNEGARAHTIRNDCFHVWVLRMRNEATTNREYYYNRNLNKRLFLSFSIRFESYHSSCSIRSLGGIWIRNDGMNLISVDWCA